MISEDFNQQTLNTNVTFYGVLCTAQDRVNNIEVLDMRNDRGPRRDFSRQNFAPVKVGDELNVKIEAVGEKGDGIAKKDGFVLFIPNTKQGDEVRVKITKVLPKVGFAEVIGEKTEESSESPREGRAEESYDKSAESESKESNDGYEGGQDTENFGEE